MNRTLLISFVILIMLGCSSTTKEPSSNQSDSYINFSSNPTVSIESSKTIKNFSFSTNSSWSIDVKSTKASLEWLEISPMSGKAGDIEITIAVTENLQGRLREAKATIKAGNTTKDINISQSGVSPILTLDKDNETLPSTAGEIEINVTSNIDWEITGLPDWLSVDHKIGSGNKVVTIRYSENSGNSSRSVTISFAGEGVYYPIILTQETNQSQDDPQLDILDKEEL